MQRIIFLSKLFVTHPLQIVINSPYGRKLNTTNNWANYWQQKWDEQIDTEPELWFSSIWFRLLLLSGRLLLHNRWRRVSLGSLVSVML